MFTLPEVPEGVAPEAEVRSTVLSGDVLFAGSIGRSDFPNSDPIAMQGSLRRFLELDDVVPVLPGHGPATTMERERATNPYLQGLAP